MVCGCSGKRIPFLFLLLQLTLTLLEAGILFVNHVELAFATHNLAVYTSFFDRCPYFHFLKC